MQEWMGLPLMEPEDVAEMLQDWGLYASPQERRLVHEKRDAETRQQWASEAAGLRVALAVR